VLLLRFLVLPWQLRLLLPPPQPGLKWTRAVVDGGVGAAWAWTRRTSGSGTPTKFSSDRLAHTETPKSNKPPHARPRVAARWARWDHAQSERVLANSRCGRAMQAVCSTRPASFTTTSSPPHRQPARGAFCSLTLCPAQPSRVLSCNVPACSSYTFRWERRTARRQLCKQCRKQASRRAGSSSQWNQPTRPCKVATTPHGGAMTNSSHCHPRSKQLRTTACSTCAMSTTTRRRTHGAVAMTK
jgi:hypothetical protein